MPRRDPLLDQREAGLAADQRERREHDRVQLLLLQRMQDARVPRRRAAVARRIEPVVERQADHLRGGGPRQPPRQQRESQATHRDQLPTRPLRIAYTVSSELLARPSFSSTRARYTDTVFGDSFSSSAMSDSRLPDAIIVSVCSSRSLRRSCGLSLTGAVRLSTSICAISGVTYLRPCATVRTACTSSCGSPPLLT